MRQRERESKKPKEKLRDTEIGKERERDRKRDSEITHRQDSHCGEKKNEGIPLLLEVVLWDLRLFRDFGGYEVSQLGQRSATDELFNSLTGLNSTSAPKRPET